MEIVRESVINLFQMMSLEKWRKDEKKIKYKIKKKVII